MTPNDAQLARYYQDADFLLAQLGERASTPSAALFILAHILQIIAYGGGNTPPLSPLLPVQELGRHLTRLGREGEGLSEQIGILGGVLLSLALDSFQREAARN